MKFELGQVVMTRGVADFVGDDLSRRVALLELLQLHSLGDWGTVCSEDAAANEPALVEGSRLFSAYEIGDIQVWIITEADRSSTTILFPDEY